MRCFPLFIALLNQPVMGSIFDCTLIQRSAILSAPYYTPGLYLYILNENGCTSPCSPSSIHRVSVLATDLNQSQCLTNRELQLQVQNSITGTICDYLIHKGLYLDPLSGLLKKRSQSFSEYANLMGVPNCHGLDKIRDDPASCSPFEQYTDEVCKPPVDIDTATHFIDGLSKRTKRVCSTNEYEIYSGSSHEDRVCAKLTVCSGISTGYFEAIAPTPSTNRICKYVPPCTKGQYFDLEGLMCKKCPSATYVIQSRHYLQTCKPHRQSICQENGKILPKNLGDLDTTMDTLAQCKSFTFNSYGSKLNVLSGNNVAKSPAPNGCPSPTPEVQFFRNQFGPFEDEFICEQCRVCAYYKSTCQEDKDAVCGEEPQTEALYVFFLVAYLSYAAGALLIYTKHTV